MTSESQLRGELSRRMMAEDARWAINLIRSVHGTDALGLVALMGSHHLVRIVFEGERLIRLPEANFGVPELARLLPATHSQTTARVRHSSKLLDDTKRSPETVLHAMAKERAAARRNFIQNKPRIMHSFCTDLGLYRLEGEVVAATIPIAFRMGFSPDAREAGVDVSELSKEWGAALGILAAADGGRPGEDAFSVVGHFDPAWHDVRVDKYLKERFNPLLSLDEKLLLLMIEADLNVNRLFLPLTGDESSPPVFRMRVVTLFHSLTAVNTILSLHRDLRRFGDVREVLRSNSARRLLSHEGKQIRNCSVHYGLRDSRITPCLDQPMFGLVESLYPGMTWDAFNHDVQELTTSLSFALRDWSP